MYPGLVPEFGSDFVATFKLSELNREVGDSIEGTVTLSVERADGDPASAVTGKVTVEFTAPLIAERIAECNVNITGDACAIEQPPGR